MNKKRIACLIVYGPEVRAFLHSGLIKKLSEKYDVSIITTHPESTVFEKIDYASVHQMPLVSENFLLERLRGLTRKSQSSWLKRRNFATWRHYIPLQVEQPLPLRNRLWRAIFQQSIWFHIWPSVEKIIARFLGTHPSWRKLLHELDVDCLVFASLKGINVLPALQTARNIDCKLVNFPNSWKDIFVSSYLPVVADKIIMQNITSANFLLAANPHVSQQQIAISSSLHLEKIIHPDKIWDRTEFCQIAGLNSERPYICYTAGTPLAVSGELEVIRQLILILQDHPEQPQILLRINPMDDGNQYLELQDKFPEHIVIQRPIWEWKPLEDWCCALEDDIALWFNTIYHSICNVSIPSTVTMEFAALKKAVINVCFDILPNIPEDSSIARFWQAPFYDEIRQSKYAVPVFSLKELKSVLQCVLEDSIEIPEPSFIPTRDPVNRMFSEIEAVLN